VRLVKAVWVVFLSLVVIALLDAVILAVEVETGHKVSAWLP
jgi:hypothetical protein